MTNVTVEILNISRLDKEYSERYNPNGNLNRAQYGLSTIKLNSGKSKRIIRVLFHNEHYSALRKKNNPLVQNSEMKQNVSELQGTDSAMLANNEPGKFSNSNDSARGLVEVPGLNAVATGAIEPKNKNGFSYEFRPPYSNTTHKHYAFALTPTSELMNSVRDYQSSVESTFENCGEKIRQVKFIWDF